MKFRPLRLPGAWEIALEPKRDERGHFMRTYDRSAFLEHGLSTEWVQQNESRSVRKHLIRGLHFQLPPHAETKVVRAVRGAVLDVLVDLRTGSPTYGQWDSIELTDDNHRMAYVPRGFAHGYCTLTDETLVEYRVDAAYAPAHEAGLRWDDPALGIRWPTSAPTVSDRDTRHPPFAELVSPFRFSP